MENLELKVGDVVVMPNIPIAFTVASLHLDPNRDTANEKERASLIWWNSKEESINSINVAKCILTKKGF